MLLEDCQELTLNTLINHLIGYILRLRVRFTEFAEAMHENAWKLRRRIEERIDALMEKESA